MGNIEQPARKDQPLVLPTEFAPQTHSSSHSSEPTSVGLPQAEPATETALILGSTLGPYRLLAKLGEGGMGAVYKAQHTKLDKSVAIKVLPDHLTRHAASVSRFEREMKAVGKINHPNIVQAFDAGQFGGTHYLAMEYVEGVDLLQLVKDRGLLPVEQACDMIRQASLALAAAHGVGLVHRDIKPANLLLATSGQIKLLDLGLALLGDEAVGSTELTTAGQTFGTPDYMAPEQWEDAHAADARTDLYALGCTLFYLLVGHPPYGTEKYKTAVGKMKAHTIDPIPDFPESRPDIPEGVKSIYRQLLAKTPNERLQTAAELAAALVPFISGGRLETVDLNSVSSPHAPTHVADGFSFSTVASAPSQPPGSTSVVNTAVEFYPAHRSQCRETSEAAPTEQLNSRASNDQATQGAPPRKSSRKFLLAAG